MICGMVFHRLADGARVVCILESPHACACAFAAGSLLADRPPGVIVPIGADARPTLRDEAGRVRAVVDAWHP